MIKFAEKFGLQSLKDGEYKIKENSKKIIIKI